jgi:hypothetical protein
LHGGRLECIRTSGSIAVRAVSGRRNDDGY